MSASRGVRLPRSVAQRSTADLLLAGAEEKGGLQAGTLRASIPLIL